MEKAKAALGLVVLLVFAVSIVGAYPTPNPGQTIVTKPNPQMFAPFINIFSIKIAPAAPGNSEPVTAGVKVQSAIKKEDICGLDASNFKLETITVPPGGAAVVIKNVYATSSTAVNQPVDCNFWLELVPTSFQGTQYTWLTGTYTLKLYYLKDGQQIADKTFSFRV